MNMIEDVQPAVGVPTSCLVIIYILLYYIYLFGVSVQINTCWRACGIFSLNSLRMMLPLPCPWASLVI